MAAEIITLASLKSGVGKTVTSLALATAAASAGLDAVVLDLDPAGGLSASLRVAGMRPTISDALDGELSLLAALHRHSSGVRVASSHRSLSSDSLTEQTLRAALSSVLLHCDLVVLDTGMDPDVVVPPLRVADRIVICTAPDVLSLRAAALTAGIADDSGVLHRVAGLLVGRVPRPVSGSARSLMTALARSGLALETAVDDDPHIADASSPEALTLGRTLLREVATRTPPVEALRQFIALAQSRPPFFAAAGFS